MGGCLGGVLSGGGGPGGWVGGGGGPSGAIWGGGWGGKSSPYLDLPSI